MAKISLLALTVLFVVATIGAADFDAQLNLDSHVNILTSNSEGISLQFDLNDLESQAVFQDGAQFDDFSIENEGFTHELGKPRLPAVSKFVVVPPDAGLELIVRADDPVRIPAENQLRICHENGETGVAAFNAEPNRGIYPPVVAEMSEPVIIRGVRLVRVTVYPVQFDFDNNVYLERNRIEADIEYTDDTPVNPVEYPIRRHRSQHFMKFIQGIAINADEVGRDDPDRDILPPYLGHYLIVTHENCLEYAAPFLEWRRKQGWKIDILSMTANQAGNSNTVKDLIQERYDAYLEEGIDPFDHIMIIGDHIRNDGVGPASQWIVHSPAGQTIWGNLEHADWFYACLEGGNNDHYADVAISRWCSGNAELMRVFVARTMSYEVNPYMEDTDWFTRGAIYAQRWAGNYHNSLATNVRWAKHIFERWGFDDIRVYENMDQHDSNGALVVQFINRQFNDGVNVMLGRAENYGYRNGFPANRSDIYPIDIDIAGHHEWSCWHMLRDPTMNNLKGPCAATTGWGGPQTLWNSVIWLEIVNAFMLRDLTYGWCRLQGVIMPDTYIPGFNTNIFPQGKTDIVFYGDPAIQWWQKIPEIVEVDSIPPITPGCKMVNVHVIDPEEDVNVAGAQVTVYVPGDMPDYDDDEYADYDDMFMMTMKSDEDGNAQFVFDNDVTFESGTLWVTVTGRNILPNISEVPIEVPDIALELADYELTETDGNDDGIINPGETFRLALTALNISEDSDAEDVIAVLTSLSPYVTVVENNELTFGDIEAESSVDSEDYVTLRFAVDCPDGASRPITKPKLQVEFISVEGNWTTALTLNPVAPNLEFRSAVGGFVIDDSVSTINIEINNVGGLDAPAMSARLISNGMGVSVIEDVFTYPAIESGGHGRLDRDRYLISGNRVVVPGSKTDMIMIFQSEDGFIDSVYFELQVMEPRENAPGGPDNYGYIVFDNTDTDWEMAPEYDWVEICPDEDPDFEGIEVEDLDRNSPLGDIAVIELPFETQFYGWIYDHITVATNGFISMGIQDYCTNYQNWPMDRCMGGGVGMLAPFWDDLRMTNDANIYYFYDEDDSRFIIEWYKFNHRSGGGGDLTFQVILYDRDVWITETGDQNILFQYKEISQSRGRGSDWTTHVPYASVGISSPEGNAGINYTFNNVYPVTSAAMQDRRALLFSTSPRYKSCILYGWVTDAANDNPVESAIVFTKHGFTAFTDEEGYWRIGNALAEVPFDIYCLKQGYNDSTEYDIEVPEGDSLRIDFNLLHPEFTPSTWNLQYMLDPGYQVELGFSITNTGNGPMDWKIERRLLGAANAPPWEYRQAFAVGEPVDDDHVEAMVFVNQMFLVAGGNHGHSTIYRFDREGAFIDTFAQFNLEFSRGMRDMTWDGELVWGAINDSVYGFTPDGELVSTLGGYRDPIRNRPITNIAYDFDRDVLWLSGTTTDIIALNRDNERIDSLEIDRRDLRIYGLSYWEDDPDGYTLYALARMSDPPGQMIYKFNPNTNDTMFVAQIFPERNSSPGGLFITNKYDVYSWVLMSMQSAGRDAGGDRIELWQIEARRDWFQCDIMLDQRVEADSGRIETGETFDFILSLNSEELPDTLFQGEMLFYHNADSGRGHIYVDLDVIGPMLPYPFDLMSPANGDTLDSTNVTLAWNPSFDPNHDDTLTYVGLIESLDDSYTFEVADTSWSVDVDTLFGLNPEEPAQFTWKIKAVSGEDTVECNAVFGFEFIPNALLREMQNQPVEFCLESVYPNPFNAAATINFGVDKALLTTLRAFDIAGRQVAVIYNDVPEVGYHRVVWNAKNIPSGVYLLKLESAGRVKMAKTTLIK